MVCRSCVETTVLVEGPLEVEVSLRDRRLSVSSDHHNESIWTSAPTHDELNQGDDGAGGGSSHTALKLQQQAAEIGHLRSAVEELRETNLSLQDEIAKRNGELMQSLSQLMEKTTDLTTAANTNSNAGTANASEGPSSVSAKLDPDDLEKIAEVVAAKLASQTQTTNSAAVSLRGSGESDAVQLQLGRVVVVPLFFFEVCIMD